MASHDLLILFDDPTKRRAVDSLENENAVTEPGWVQGTVFMRWVNKDPRFILRSQDSQNITVYVPESHIHDLVLASEIKLSLRGATLHYNPCHRYRRGIPYSIRYTGGISFVFVNKVGGPGSNMGPRGGESITAKKGSSLMP